MQTLRKGPQDAVGNVDASMLSITTVKPHLANAAVESGFAPRQQQLGNDSADESAEKGG